MSFIQMHEVDAPRIEISDRHSQANSGVLGVEAEKVRCIHARF